MDWICLFFCVLESLFLHFSSLVVKIQRLHRNSGADATVSLSSAINHTLSSFDREEGLLHSIERM